jgi:hypothetical protein
MVSLAMSQVASIESGIPNVFLLQTAAFHVEREGAILCISGGS